MFDRVRFSGSFGFRRDDLAGKHVVILLHVRQERVPVRQDVNGTFLLRIEIFVGVDSRLGVESVLFAQPRDQLGGGVLAELPVADALDSNGVQIAADGRAVCALRFAAGAAVCRVPAAHILAQILPDLVVPHIIMDGHAGHIAVIGRPRVLLRRVGAGRHFDVVE